MLSWKTVCQSLLVISLLFFAIPIRVKGPETETRSLFEQYVKDFNKSYEAGTEEYEKRYEAFKYTLFRIEEYNSIIHNDSAMYGLTQFSDLTEGEFADKHLDKVKPKPNNRQNRRRNKDSKKKSVHHSKSNEVDSDEDDYFQRIKREISSEGLPLKIDWRKKRIISPVKNQGICGACWAFSTIQTIEAMNARKTGNLTLLSVQEAIDCAANGNQGCAGGDICNLLQWMTQYNVPAMPEDEYPFREANGTCRFKNFAQEVGVRVKYYTCDSLVDNERLILKWLATKGPVAVAVNALSWQDYLGGVIQFHCDGDRTALNHAVQLVGYDLQAPTPYYIAKNSWGESYGHGGYLYLAADKNMCGLANEVSMIVVE